MMKRILVGVFFLLFSFVPLSIFSSTGPPNQYAVIIFEENLGKFSSESVVKNTISQDLLSRNLEVIETPDVPLKSIRMEKVYFFDANGQKVYKSASFTANVSETGMEVNSDYKMNVFPVLNIEDIIWELDYKKALEIARTAKAARLIAGKVLTDEVNIESEANLMGMRSVKGQIFLRLIDVSSGKLLASYTESVTKMGSSAESGSFDAITALSAKALKALESKIQ